MENNDLKSAILDTLKEQNGILFADSAFVFRETYSGRDIIAKNSKFEKGYVDERNYVPVEIWVMSITEAENGIKKENEGLTFVKLNNGSEVSLKNVFDLIPEILPFKNKWPLTKILDIGGQPMKTSLGTTEIPPIPVHVHSGEVVNGKAQKPGKTEAYFFLPTNVPPYNKELGKVITRLGLKQNVTKEEFIKRLQDFGKNDSMYELLQEYEVEPYSGWTIFEGTVHAPGPWISFEIQFPQDDFNLMSWRMGEYPEDTERKKLHNELLLKGLKDEEDFMEQMIDWEKSIDNNFKKKHFRPIKIIESGKWGRRFQIFFDNFYGEGWEINPNASHTIQGKDSPTAGIIWSGEGEFNGFRASNTENQEFFVVPGSSIDIKNISSSSLLIYTFKPLVKGLK